MQQRLISFFDLCRIKRKPLHCGGLVKWDSQCNSVIEDVCWTTVPALWGRRSGFSVGVCVWTMPRSQRQLQARVSIGIGLLCSCTSSRLLALAGTTTMSAVEFLFYQSADSKILLCMSLHLMPFSRLLYRSSSLTSTSRFNFS